MPSERVLHVEGNNSNYIERTYQLSWLVQETKKDYSFHQTRFGIQDKDMNETYLLYSRRTAPDSIQLLRYLFDKSGKLYYCRIMLKIGDDISLKMILKVFCHGEYPDDMDEHWNEVFDLGQGSVLKDHIKAELLLAGGLRGTTIKDLEKILLQPDLFSYDDDMTFIDDKQFTKEYKEDWWAWVEQYKTEEAEIEDFL